MIKFNSVISDNPNPDLEFPPTMHPLIIKSKNEKLLGSYFKAAGKEKNPLLILLHGFPGNETNFDIAHAVRRFGINVAVFHYRGSWGSGGSFSISNSLSDVSSVIDHFSDKEISKQYNVENKKIILVGHSMGGFLALLTSIKYPQIKNIASLAGFNFGFFTDYIIKNPQFLNATIEGLSQGAMLVEGASGQKIYNEMLANKDEWNLVKRVTEFTDKNILLVGAEDDEVSHLQLHHYPLVESLSKNNVKLKSAIYKTGHSFSSTRIRITTEIINWLKKIK
ncbi:MAG: alpha/beta fold hydrolase [Melioribacteraceae bacterium]|jgi:dipeptidyl aminopeptidase/acylaminoacyl peptidase|nr:alpha/beta fold hydrolase [Melioribacteraceae bacterium]